VIITQVIQLETFCFLMLKIAISLAVELRYLLSFSDIEILRQLPTTDAEVFFTCRHCKIQEIVPHAFIDTPNIEWLDLAYNELGSIDLTPEIFRGPESDDKYAPIKLETLILRHNKISFIDELIFEHTPSLKLLDLSYNPIQEFSEGAKSALATLHKLEVMVTF
jgi:Leucine rich repeat